MPKKRDGRNRARARLKAVPSENDQGILGQGGKCNSLKKDGKTRCTQPAGQGTDHAGYGACQFHGGNSPSLRRHAAKVQVRALAQELGMEADEALVATVRMAAGAVAWAQGMIEQLEFDDLTPGTTTEAGMQKLARLEHWRQVYADERDRLARHAKLALDAGIAERQVQIAEQQAALIAHVIQAILEDLHLTPEQQEQAPGIARRHLLALPAGEQPA